MGMTYLSGTERDSTSPETEDRLARLQSGVVGEETRPGGGISHWHCRSFFERHGGG